ncbi:MULTISPECIES: hypothetical protein [Stenotrophomonas]|nr:MULTISPECIES: hypothetical protein [Stenotrophomonas]OMP40374.1 hypothetical protein BMR86_07420 [Stenotrophomonas sp. KAs 5-3]AIL09894.1 hypothetical protein DP16_1991 [Stenotrophomonas maltophilia]ELN2585208.1 hypothetical protein [Stenotrophomonas maltophilia]ELN2587495.1 hypothetical protein [Stenotrophomonas maltophilia]ELN2593620.1 hypothetical protein [Stenotrophomonas maltophilia]
MTSLAYDLLMALIPGTAAGYYSGLLMAKLSKFNALKYEALRAIRSINYMGDASNTQIISSDKSEELHLIASELFLLKHKGAGISLMQVSNELLNSIAACKHSAHPVDSFIKQISDWQARIRGLKVGRRFFLPWGQI